MIALQGAARAPPPEGRQAGLIAQYTWEFTIQSYVYEGSLHHIHTPFHTCTRDSRLSERNRWKTPQLAHAALHERKES